MKKPKRRQIKPGQVACRFTVFFDGCCEPTNPGGSAGFGCVILENGQKVYEHSGFIPASPTTSNNLAEYLAFCDALSWFSGRKLFDASIQIFGDSKLVIEQMFGTWKIRGGRYIEHAFRARELLKNFRNISGFWIPREENSIADEVSKQRLRDAGIEFRIQPE